MTQNEIFAQRLKNARVMKGYSMDELVSAMGNSLSKMAISKYEKCQLSPNSSVIISLSKALEQPVDYFFKPFTVRIDSVKFRKIKSKLGAKQEKSIKENISDLVERYITIEEICNAAVIFNSPFKDKISTSVQVKKAAFDLRELWKIGNDGIVNVIDLLEEHGIKVMEIDAPDSFDGLSSMVNDKYPVIVLNKNFPSERKRFTALHELGHIILPFDESVEEKNEENLCSLFSNEMLILESVFKNMFGSSRHDISYQELRAIQMQYGISCDALMYKAKESGIISEQRHKTYCIQKNRIPEFKKRMETSLYPPEESNRFVRLVYNALSNELITTSKAASLLHQSLEQVRGDLALV
ncbi:MAG: ImmA/IrrE family metallo-endopeptidase [Treponema sp.]|nr:ImmA/IrrE family metallo-endopeptidase [Treponema sp.]